MTRLRDLVQTSRAVGETPARLAKVRALADRLRALDADEIEIGAQYLSGSAPQGRFGIGYSVLQEARSGEPPREPTLTLVEVDRSLGEIAAMRGAGAAARRIDTLRSLFSRAIEPEREFLIRLLAGELRQGALIGVMIDAIAAAAELPVAPVRRAMMYARNVGAVARTALLEGERGLAKFQLEILSPVAPMLAQTAADPADALRRLGAEAAFEWKMDGARIQVHKSGETVRIYTRNLTTSAPPCPKSPTLRARCLRAI
jgi:DNA ligase-1